MFPRDDISVILSPENSIKMPNLTLPQNVTFTSLTLKPIKENEMFDSLVLK